MKKTVVLVADTKGWAFDNIAQSIRSEFHDSKDFDVTIVYTSEYSSCREFFIALCNIYSNFDIVHFFWREYLRLLINGYYYLPLSCRRRLFKAALTTSIPDHLFNKNSQEIEDRIEFFNLLDGYVTTSKKLYQEYIAIKQYQPPYGAIVDHINIKPSYRARSSSTIRALWVGNSQWGKEYGFEDYKGLETIVKPAVVEAKKIVQIIDLQVIDSAKQKLSRSETLQSYEDADVLLISSETEGTPLPLLESMAKGCAVISTDVGIASEVLPSESHEYIVERSVDAFKDALVKLASDINHLESIKSANYNSYQKFGYSLAEKWQDFFLHSLAVNKKKGEFRVKIFLNKNILLTRYAYFKVMRKVGLRRKLFNLKNARVIGKPIRFFKKKESHRQMQNLYSVSHSIYLNTLVENETLVLYSNRWPGVSSSTRALFGTLAVPYPLYSFENPEIDNHLILNKVAEAITTAKTINTVVISGGVKLHLELLKRVKQYRPNIKTLLVWHGSPAQWFEYHHVRNFNEWIDLYEQGVIDGFITLKESCHKLLKGLDVDSEYVKNFYPANVFRRKSIKGEVNIGLFSSANDWNKNLSVQALALLGIGNCKLITNTCFDYIHPRIRSGIQYKRVARGHSTFITQLSKLHINLYVTHSECSPMIPIESVAHGVPCIVGPAGNIYRGFSLLENFLIVKEVDNSEEIKKRIFLIIENYDCLIDSLNNFNNHYNLQCKEFAQDIIYNEYHFDELIGKTSEKL